VRELREYFLFLSFLLLINVNERKEYGFMLVRDKFLFESFKKNKERFWGFLESLFYPILKFLQIGRFLSVNYII
jgi:hypothetical protein